MPVSPFRVRKFLIVFIIAWVILMADHALLLYWFNFSLEVSVIDSAISNITLLMHLPDGNEQHAVLCSGH